jgi:hypothetical protein
MIGYHDPSDGAITFWARGTHVVHHARAFHIFRQNKGRNPNSWMSEGRNELGRGESTLQVPTPKIMSINLGLDKARGMMKRMRMC